MKSREGTATRITHRDVLYCLVLHFCIILSIYSTENLEDVFKCILMSDYLSKLWPFMPVVSNKTVYTIFMHFCTFVYISLELMN